MKKFISIILVILFVSVLQGCAPNNKSTGNTTKNTSGSGSGTGNGSGGGGQKDEKIENYSVKVVYDGKELKSYTIEDIKKMTTSSIDVDSATESGPSIDYILKENNIADYSQITFTGMMKDKVTLTKAQISQGTLLDITNHNTVKLAAKAIDKNTWVKDIATIKIDK